MSQDTLIPQLYRWSALNKERLNLLLSDDHKEDEYNAILDKLSRLEFNMISEFAARREQRTNYASHKWLQKSKNLLGG